MERLGYEKVTLTTATAEQLGQQLSEDDRKRGAVSMSGRKGLGVKVDDLIDQLEASALSEVESRHPELSHEDQRDTALCSLVARSSQHAQPGNIDELDLRDIHLDNRGAATHGQVQQIAQYRRTATIDVTTEDDANPISTDVQ